MSGSRTTIVGGKAAIASGVERSERKNAEHFSKIFAERKFFGRGREADEKLTNAQQHQPPKTIKHEPPQAVQANSVTSKKWLRHFFET